MVRVALRSPTPPLNTHLLLSRRHVDQLANPPPEYRQQDPPCCADSRLRASTVVIQWNIHQWTMVISGNGHPWMIMDGPWPSMAHCDHGLMEQPPDPAVDVSITGTRVSLFLPPSLPNMHRQSGQADPWTPSNPSCSRPASLWSRGVQPHSRTPGRIALHEIPACVTPITHGLP